MSDNQVQKRQQTNLEIQAENHAIVKNFKELYGDDKEMIPYVRAAMVGYGSFRLGFATPESALLTAMVGKNIGLDPISSINNIYPIESGKRISFKIGYTALASVIKDSERYDYKVIEHTELKCTLQFFCDDKEEGLPYTYSIEDAKKVIVNKDGLTMNKKDNWRNYPRNMLFAACLSHGSKCNIPSVFHGQPLYTEADHIEEDFIDTTASPSTSPIVDPDQEDSERKRKRVLGEECVARFQKLVLTVNVTEQFPVEHKLFLVDWKNYDWDKVADWIDFFEKPIPTPTPTVEADPKPDHLASLGNAYDTAAPAEEQPKELWTEPEPGEYAAVDVTQPHSGYEYEKTIAKLSEKASECGIGNKDYKGWMDQLSIMKNNDDWKAFAETASNFIDAMEKNNRTPQKIKATLGGTDE